MKKRGKTYQKSPICHCRWLSYSIMVVVICCGRCAVSCGCCNWAVGCHCGWVVLLYWLMSWRLWRAVMPRCQKYIINWFYFVHQIMAVWLSWLECWLHVSGWLRVWFLLLTFFFLNKGSATPLTLGNPRELVGESKDLPIMPHSAFHLCLNRMGQHDNNGA